MLPRNAAIEPGTGIRNSSTDEEYRHLSGTKVDNTALVAKRFQTGMRAFELYSKQYREVHEACDV